MDGEVETIVILDELPPRPVTLSGEVARLCAEGEEAAALTLMAQAIERLARDSHTPQEIGPRVEEVLRAWGYVPLTDDPPLPAPAP
jgi:hypothetical protein